jgi:hypothetical protein
MPAAPLAPPPALTPVVTSAQIVAPPAGSTQNMVLRIELAFVDETNRANLADAAKRAGHDADVRAPEYNPRTHGRGEPLPEPEYEWGVPPPISHEQLDQGQGQSQQLDWDLPQVSGPQLGNRQPDQPAPWSTPQQQQAPTQRPVAPPPTWAMTEPTPAYSPEPPRYLAPPAAQQDQQPAAEPWQQQTQLPSQQPDLYLQPDEPAQTSDDHIQPVGTSSSILTAALTVVFALLVIVLVLVFFQLMTSLLK